MYNPKQATCNDKCRKQKGITKENFRPAKDTTAYYTNFKEVAESLSRKNSLKDKPIRDLENRQKHFLRTCSTCNSVMKYIAGTNVVCCSNPECAGRIKKNNIEVVNNDAIVSESTEAKTEAKKVEKEKTVFVPSHRLLNDEGVSKAKFLFK